MQMTLLVHIVAGAVGIITGYVALSAAKGGSLHRASGVLFVYAMVVMSVSGAGMAAVRGLEDTVIAGLLAGYLVVTALTTVRPATAASRRLDLGMMLLALAVGVWCAALVLDSLLRGEGARDGVPVPMLFLFGAIALSAGASDLRRLRSPATGSGSRLARHLWRMCFALFIATGSFFLGQADEFPEPLRVFPLLAIPAFLPLLAMPYWLWRVRRKRSAPDVAGAVAPGAIASDTARRAPAGPADPRSREPVRVPTRNSRETLLQAEVRS